MNGIVPDIQTFRSRMNDNGGSPDCRITLGNKEGRDDTEEGRIPFFLNAADEEECDCRGFEPHVGRQFVITGVDG